jgi:hypothetical protein
MRSVWSETLICVQTAVAVPVASIETSGSNPFAPAGERICTVPKLPPAGR